jgi:hypothetical protein
MLSFPLDLVRELTEDDVLHVDPVVEYERRRVWRDWADKRLAQVGDGTDDLLERGRPTGP